MIQIRTTTISSSRGYPQAERICEFLNCRNDLGAPPVRWRGGSGTVARALPFRLFERLRLLDDLE
jgi:hypothetical protein